MVKKNLKYLIYNSLDMISTNHMTQKLIIVNKELILPALKPFFTLKPPIDNSRKNEHGD